MCINGDGRTALLKVRLTPEEKNRLLLVTKNEGHAQLSVYVRKKLLGELESIQSLKLLKEIHKVVVEETKV